MSSSRHFIVFLHECPKRKEKKNRWGDTQRIRQRKPDHFPILEKMYVRT